jgi:hypothetical protein
MKMASALVLSVWLIFTVTAVGGMSLNVAEMDRARILAAANIALTQPPITITQYRAKLSDGGPHDFYSNGDYWWPNTNTPDGLPYVSLDGRSNPNNFNKHRDCLRQLHDAVAALGAAYKITGDDRYAAKAAELLRVFFIDPATRMNPSLQYAQAVPGVSSGRSYGIIDSLHLIEIPPAIEAMEKSAAFPPEVVAGLKHWFSDYTHWMRTSKNGLYESNAANNHAVAYWLQIAVFAQFTGDAQELADCRKRFKEVFVAKQMAADGSFSRELERTKPYGYSIFQLDNMATLCQVLSTPDDNLWQFQLPDGRGMRKAMEFMYPYLSDKSKWLADGRRQDIQAWNGWPARQPSLLFAGLAYGEPKYLDLWGKLSADPTNSEVRRNIAIMEPVLWVQGGEVTVSVDTKHPGAAISPDFTGLSFELTQLMPGPDGLRYFRPDNTRLIDLFRTLGIRNLRVGGNTADRNWRRPPDQADIDSLFGFAKAADLKVIYCLRLHNGIPEYDARTAKYIMDHYPDQVACFSIGQEPTAYPRTTNWVDGVPKKGPRLSFATYSNEWKAFADIIIQAVPDAKFCGPSTDDDPTWPREFMDAFGQGNHVTLITTHLYPGRSGDKVPSPEIGRDEMLSGSFVAAYQKLYDGFGPTALADGLPFRLEEVNNFFNGGASNVSDTFASALWGLDFMYWWAEHGANGLNFHTGDKVAAGAELRPSRYTAYFSTPGGFTVRPLGYGIAAFNIGGRGRLLPATISNPNNLNLDVYSVLGNDKAVYVTIINKEHGAQAMAASVSLTTGAEVADPQLMTLSVPDEDIAAKTGVTLGGASIKSDGSWNGTWTELPSTKSGILNVTVPAGSASIVKLAN